MLVLSTVEGAAHPAPLPESGSDTLHSSEGARRFRYGGNTFAMVALCLAVLVAVNLVMTKVKARWDTTAGGSYTLSDQTKNVLTSLPEAVKVTAFHSPEAAASRERAEDLLTEYQVHTDKLQVEYVDPNLHLNLAREMAIQQDSTLVFQMGDRRQDITAATEIQITGALLKLTSTQQTTVYFLSGHGERAIDDFAASGFGALGDALKRDNFVVEPLNLATTSGDTWKQGVVLVNTSVRVSNVGGRAQVSPVAPLLPEEGTKLAEFLNAGGRAVFLLDPSSDPSYVSLLMPFGLTLGQGFALDPTSAFGDIGTPAVQRPSRSPITEALPLTLFPKSTAILDAGERPAGITVQALMETTSDSWLETDPRVAQYDEGPDTKGPLRLAVSIETPGLNGRRGRVLVVASAAAFANDMVQGFAGIGNQDFLLNGVNWLAQQEAAIGIRPKTAETPTVILTQAQSMMVLLSSTALFPSLILLLGIGTWWSRR